MQQKKIWLFLTLCSILIFLPTSIAKAAEKPDTLGYQFDYDGLRYEVSKTADFNGIGEVCLRGVANKKKLSSVVIPETVKNQNVTYEVTSIYHNAFMNQKKLKEVSIPKTVHDIGEMVFADCTGLEKIVLPDSITNMSFGIFNGCTSLKEVTLPDKLKYLPSGIFLHCTNLKKIVLPEQIMEIRSFAFSQCTSLEQIVIPSSVMLIQYNAFSGCTALEKVELPEKLEIIPEAMFYGCSALKEINLPDTLKIIGKEAFFGCSSMTSIRLPKQVEEMGVRVFSDCNNLLEVYISDRLTAIPERAFMNCSHIEKVVIPDQVTLIASQAFAACAKLREVSLPEGITQIHRDAFTGTYLTEHYAGDFLVIGDVLIDGEKAGSIITIPDTVKYIASGAFAENKELKKVVFTGAATKIGSHAFTACTALEQIELPKELENLPDGIFSGCTKLAFVSLPEGISEIGEEAFNQCKSLKDITFPNNIKSIGDYAFSGCDGLTSINIPVTIKNVGRYAFSSCKALKKIEVAAESVLRNAFDGCTKLTSVTMTDDVLNVGKSAFMNCENVREVTLSKRLTVLDYDIFAGCKSLASIKIPNSIEYILEGAFRDCSGLKRRFTSANLIYTDESAFAGCSITKSMKNEDKAYVGELLDKSPASAEAIAGHSAVQLDKFVLYKSGTDPDMSLYGLYRRSAGSVKKIGTTSISEIVGYEDYIYLQSDNNMYRIPVKGGKDEKIIKNLDKLISIGDHGIYYLSKNKLYRCDKDGNDRQIIFKLPAWTHQYNDEYKFYDQTNIIFVNDLIYYFAPDKEEKINLECRDMNGKNKRVVMTDCSVDLYNDTSILFAIQDEIYFLTTDNKFVGIAENEEDKIIYDTSQRTTIKKITDEAIYYVCEDKLWRLYADGTAERLLGQDYPGLDDPYCEVSVSADEKTIAICYSGMDESDLGQIYVMNYDGTHKRMITEADSLTDVELIGDYVYFYKDNDYENGPYVYMRTRYR